jgi:predicted ATPase/DNA-binding XRE family transcriptional regulator
VPRPSFAALLRQLRQAAGLTQAELATRARVGVRTVRDLEAGRASRPQRSTVDLIGDALGLTGSDRARFEAASRGRPLPTVTLPRIEPLIGRDDDLAGIAELLEIADLITIVGLSGVGKAVLALTVANEVVDRYAAGVGAIQVTEASSEAEILASVASALAASDVDDLTSRRQLHPADRALLVMANADRSPTAASAAIGWLRRHTGIRILATSRQPLGLLGEHQWALGPLEVPPPDADGPAVFDYPASRLFLDRLRRVRAQPLTAADAAVLGALVRRLGGLPFALELAAARGRVLDLPELFARTIGDARGGGPRDTAGPGAVSGDLGESDPAGQTVRLAVLASWELLTPVEQTCLCWLSVFQWRWSMELAEELLAASPETSGCDVVAVVDRLVGLGLVRARTHTSVLRLHVFDAVRRVALEQAAARGVLTSARDQHAVVIARVCARAAASGAGPGQTPEPADRTTLPPVIAHLLADIQAAANHLGATSALPHQRSQPPADAIGGLRRGLIEWLSGR